MGLLFISLLLGEPSSILRARAMQPGDYFEKISSPVSLRYTVARFRVSGYFLDVGDATGRLFHYKRRNWMFLLRTLGAFEIAVPRIYKFSSLVNFPRDKYFQPRSLYVAECWNADGDDRFSRCRHFSYVFGFTILLLLKVNRYRCVAESQDSEVESFKRSSDYPQNLIGVSQLCLESPLKLV